MTAATITTTPEAPPRSALQTLRERISNARDLTQAEVDALMADLCARRRRSTE